MSIAQTVQKSIETIPAGTLFSYQELPSYARSPNAVIKAVKRMVDDKRVKRLSKGKFYVPKKGLLGTRKPSDQELVRSVLYKGGKLRGYITGLSLFNQLGLTTQMPRTITVAVNGARQRKDFGTISIKTQSTRVPIEQKEVILLQYLDVLKDIKSIPDADVDFSLVIMRKKVSELSKAQQSRLVALAEEFYSPQTKALVGLLYSNLRLPLSKTLACSLNPTTSYNLNLDEKNWPEAKDWNIR
uniref:DUF6088 family protein n=1 Tax=Ningiella ruwaisensis TaxID=2364274 RepID=UPI00109FA724|nr:DUF6088 family protein [Ningiella ruwaisensis]